MSFLQNMLISYYSYFPVGQHSNCRRSHLKLETLFFYVFALRSFTVLASFSIATYPTTSLSFHPRSEKTGFFICKNKGADQLCGDRPADQRLCFRYINSTNPCFLNPKFNTSSHLLLLYNLICAGPGWKPRRQVLS